MEFLPDSACCTKCLKKGIRNPFLAHKVRPNGSTIVQAKDGPHRHPGMAPRWCKACWQARIRRNYQCATTTKQRHLRSEEWKRRAMMSREERSQTRLVHIPPTIMAGRNKGKRRNPIAYLAMYARERNAVLRQLGEDVPPELPSRHKVGPTA